MRCDSTPFLVYKLTSAVAAVTVESMGVTPPPDVDVKRVKQEVQTYTRQTKSKDRTLRIKVTKHQLTEMQNKY